MGHSEVMPDLLRAFSPGLANTRVPRALPGAIAGRAVGAERNLSGTLATATPKSILSSGAALDYANRPGGNDAREVFRESVA